MTVYAQQQHVHRVGGSYYSRSEEHQGALRRTYSAAAPATRARARFPSGTLAPHASEEFVPRTIKKRMSGSASSSSTTAPLSPHPKSTSTTDSPPIIPADRPATASKRGGNGLLATPSREVHPAAADPAVRGVFVNDCPPSPRLTKSLLAQAQTRKRAGRHSLVSLAGSEDNAESTRRVLKLSGSTTQTSLTPAPPAPVVAPIDRQAIPDDLYESMLAAASAAKKNGQHRLQRRRFGLSGEVETVLVAMPSAPIGLAAGQHSFARSSSNQSSYSSSIFSPNPALFNYC